MGSSGGQPQPQQHRPKPPTKRPFCHRCSKPLSVCLCSRLKIPPLDNSIGITILQHGDEKDHPLNSTRVARLGFKNLTVVPVTDVLYAAQFIVSPFGDQNIKFTERSDFEKIVDGSCDLKKDLRERSDIGKIHLVGLGGGGENGFVSGECCNGDLDASECSADSEDGSCQDLTTTLDLENTHLGKRGANGVVNGECSNVPFLNHIPDGVEAVFEKYRVTISSTSFLIAIEPTVKPDIGWIMDTPVGRACISDGFTVRKLQRKRLRLSGEFQDFDEFDIVMPPGAVLLYPKGNSVISLDEVDFEVKHLVVLDGTWKKAQRMYHENPWLKFLPHLKVDSVKESLYSEVRQEPKAGYISTVESIVCALKGLGNEMKGLDELLNVFESMVGDQRRFKHERFKARAALALNSGL